jgi:uncharacterized protein YjiS (DUF1127 family)
MMIAAFVQTRDATPPPGFGAALRRASDRLADRLRRRALCARTVRELGFHTDRELADMGIARADIRRLARKSAGL